MIICVHLRLSIFYFLFSIFYFLKKRNMVWIFEFGQKTIDKTNLPMKYIRFLTYPKFLGKFTAYFNLNSYKVCEKTMSDSVSLQNKCDITLILNELETFICKALKGEAIVNYCELLITQQMNVSGSPFG